MMYILLIIIALSLHWHYYRWCIFNHRINRPQIYWSYTGDLIVLSSKIILFGIILIFFKWYLVFIPIVILFILKKIAFYKSLKSIKKEYQGDGLDEKKAEEVARQEIKGYRK